MCGDLTTNEVRLLLAYLSTIPECGMWCVWC